MDRLLDVNRTPPPNARPERQDDPRGRPERPVAKKPADARPVDSSDSSSRADRTTERSADKNGKFEIQDGKPAPDTAAKPHVDAQPEAPNAIVQDAVELVTQQPALRAKTITAAAAEPVQAATRHETADVLPLPPPIVQPVWVAATSEALKAETHALELQPAPRATAAASPPPVREIQAPAPRVEAPREARESVPARDLERAADILGQVRVHLAPRTSEAHIQLQPAELGRMTIHVTVEGARMRAEVRAETREALDAIQTHLPELRATLRDAGITTQDFQFSLGLENQPRRDNHAAGQWGPDTQNPAAPAVESPDAEHAVLLHATAAAGGVDLYA